ncbi:MAG: TetR family transcriptional regulator [Oligoflexia bacterium]|nr:TetR family transcriptional regulator [Oligoflexia bacterium]
MVNKNKSQENEQDTRERLMKAAEKIFAQKGYGGATVKEIADSAGVNISLISYHFNGKEGILRACVERFGKDRLQDAQHLLTPPENLEDMKAKLRIWMLGFLRCHVEDQSICAVLHRENLRMTSVLWDIFESTFLKTFESMVKFFEQAKKKDLIRKEVDSTLITGMLFGSLVNIGDNQEVQERWMGVSIANEKYRQQVVEQFLDILLVGVVKNV